MTYIGQYSIETPTFRALLIEGVGPSPQETKGDAVRKALLKTNEQILSVTPKQIRKQADAATASPQPDYRLRLQIELQHRLNALRDLRDVPPMPGAWVRDCKRPFNGSKPPG